MQTLQMLQTFFRLGAFTPGCSKVHLPGYIEVINNPPLPTSSALPFPVEQQWIKAIVLLPMLQLLYLPECFPYQSFIRFIIMFWICDMFVPFVYLYIYVYLLYLQRHADLKAKGIDELGFWINTVLNLHCLSQRKILLNFPMFLLTVCLSVNDAFTMEQWGKLHGAIGKVLWAKLTAIILANAEQLCNNAVIIMFVNERIHKYRHPLAT